MNEKQNLSFNDLELKYLTIMIEKDLENYKSFMDMDADQFTDMLHLLYSKLIVLTKK